MTVRWQTCGGCRYSSRCGKARDTGCYHPVNDPLPTHALVVMKARDLYAKAGAEDAREWLTAQYLELMQDGMRRLRHEHPGAPTGDLFGAHRILRLAEVAAHGVIKDFENCTEPETTSCDLCRYRGCRRKDGGNGKSGFGAQSGVDVDPGATAAPRGHAGNCAAHARTGQQGKASRARTARLTLRHDAAENES